MREAALHKWRAEEDRAVSATRVLLGPATGFGGGEGDAAPAEAGGCGAPAPAPAPAADADGAPSAVAGTECAADGLASPFCPVEGRRALMPPSSNTVSRGLWSLSAKSRGEGQVECGRLTGSSVE